MKTADVAQPTLPSASASSDLSLLDLFWQAHWIVQDGDDRAARLLGLGLGDRDRQDRCSTRAPRRAMDQFEQTFWSGQSLEELYRTLSAQAEPFDGGAVRRRDARVEAQLRRHAPLDRRAADAHREGDGRHHRARDRAAGTAASGAGDGRLGRPLHRPVRHRLGHHDQLPVDRRLEEHLAGGCRARHRRGPVRDRDRPCRRHPGDDFL